jgi:hypothetical protein
LAPLQTKPGRPIIGIAAELRELVELRDSIARKIEISTDKASVLLAELLGAHI